MTPAAQRAAKQARAEAEQRLAARPDASVWVAASAGTGKTKVLTDRVLSLMLHGTEPTRILCLTFTKAAAAEMSNRLAERLAGWAAGNDREVAAELDALLGEAPDAALLTRARQLFARVLDAPGGMKILTIHAFCQSLLGRFPLEVGVPPHFQVLDERSAAEMLAAAREEVLATARSAGAEALNQALAEISARTTEAGFGELLAELIKERGRLARLLKDLGGTEGLIAAVDDALGVSADDDAAALLAQACADEALDIMGLRLATEAMAKGSKTDREHAQIITDWLKDPAQRVTAFQRYLGAFFTDKGEGAPFKTLIYKDALALAPGADLILESEAVRLSRVRDRLRLITVARATAALLRLGAAILDAYDRHKRARAFLDYDDLILQARDLLRRDGLVSWVLYKLDGGLDHILIDEAQDTNPDQWDVIQALSAEFFAGEGRREYPRTVFAVGDAKQSIYGFQRADPVAFAAMRAHFAERAQAARQALHRVDLDVSFRSTAAVLAAVDCVFAPAEARDGVLFEEPAVTHDPVRVGQAGLIEVWPTAEPLDEDPPAPWAPPVLPTVEDRVPLAAQAPARARLARLIARRIWHWTRSPAGDADPDSWLPSRARRLRPGDILVLVRRRNEFVEELVRELKQLDVPVAGVDRMVLTDQLAVMDLVALGRSLLLPEDDLTLATVLKGPILGLSEEQLFTLAYDRSGSLWDELRRRAGEDPDFAAAFETLTELRAKTDYLRPYELYAEILGPRGGRERLLARLGPDARDPIEEFLSLALGYEREHVPALEAFLHWLEAGAQEVKRDLEHGAAAVRVMTVHGAKGLQAPVVFLPDTMQTPQAPRGLLWHSEPGGSVELPLWPVRKDFDGSVARTARDQARLAQEREHRRLLYVAMTRAEDRLYVCGWKTRTATPEACWYKMVERTIAAVAAARPFDFTAQIDGGWSGPGWSLARAQESLPEADEAALEEGKPELPLPDWAGTPPPAEPLPPRPLAPSRPSDSESAVRSPLGPDQGFRYHRGRLIHRLLESLPALPSGSRKSAGRRFLARAVHGLMVAQQIEILEETLTVLESDAFAPLFGPNSRAEVPIVGLVTPTGVDSPGSEVITGQIDRLVVESDRIFILDYKSNRPPPRTEAEVPILYLKQMAAYQIVLKQIYADRPVHCLLLWTDGPRLMQLSDALLASHAP